MTPALDVVRRRVRLDPRDPDFFNDPYPAYAAIRDAAPAFFWEDYGFWCFARFADVSALLRDRRFGRTIVERPRGAKPHLAPFDALLGGVVNLSLCRVGGTDHEREQEKRALNGFTPCGV